MQIYLNGYTTLELTIRLLLHSEDLISKADFTRKNFHFTASHIYQVAKYIDIHYYYRNIEILYYCEIKIYGIHYQDIYY